MLHPSLLKQKRTVQVAFAFVCLLTSALVLTACAGAVPRDVGIGSKLFVAAVTLQANQPAQVAVAPTSTPMPPTPAPVEEPTEEPIQVGEFPESFTLFQDELGRFELELPDGWEIEPSDAAVIASSPSGQASLAVLGLPGDVIYDEAALTAHGEAFLTTFFENEEVVINNTELQSDNSIFFDFALPDGEEPLEGIMYTEQRGLDLYQLVMLADAPQWSDYFDAVFQPVISTYFVTPLDTTEFLSGGLPLTAYVDSSGLFELSLPTDWQSDYDDGYADVSVPERYMAITSFAFAGDLEATGIEDTAADLFEVLYEQDYAIEDIEQSDNGSYSINFTAVTDEIDLRGYLFALQGDAYVYILLFQAPEKDWYGLLDTYGEVLSTYRVTPPEVAPTPEPAPAVNPYQPQEGRSRLYVFNEYNEELTFTINNQELKIPPEGIDKPVAIDLDAGDYTYTVSVPFGSANGEVSLGVNQSWAVGVRGDGAVYNPFQVYP